MSEDRSFSAGNNVNSNRIRQLLAREALLRIAIWLSCSKGAAESIFGMTVKELQELITDVPSTLPSITVLEDPMELQDVSVGSVGLRLGEGGSVILELEYDLDPDSDRAIERIALREGGELSLGA